MSKTDGKDVLFPFHSMQSINHLLVTCKVRLLSGNSEKSFLWSGCLNVCQYIVDRKWKQGLAFIAWHVVPFQSSKNFQKILLWKFISSDIWSFQLRRSYFIMGATRYIYNWCILSIFPIVIAIPIWWKKWHTLFDLSIFGWTCVWMQAPCFLTSVWWLFWPN